MFKRLLIYLLISTTFVLATNSKVMKFTSMLCTSSGKTVINFTCVIKRHSKANATLSMHLNFTRKVYDLMFQYEIDYTRLPNTEYRPLFKIDKSPICGFLNGTKNNPGFKWIMDLAEETIPKGILHPCPYSGSIDIENIAALPLSSTSNFPKGFYKYELIVSDHDDSNILTMDFKTEAVEMRKI